MSFCLPSFAKEELIRGIREGRISPEGMAELSSVERRVLLEEFIDAETAKTVNALFESKLILKSQQIGIRNWEKQIVDSKVNRVIKRDIITRLEKMDKYLEAGSKQEFLQDLVEKRLGFSATFEQSQLIMKGTKQIKEAHEKITDDMPDVVDGKTHPARYDYGMKVAILDSYIAKIKEAGIKPMSAGEWIFTPTRWIEDTFGTLKSLKSGFDNSFFLRQGRQAFMESPSIWFNNFVKSWGDIVKEFKGVDAMMLAKAEIFGRKNALNGKWDNAGLDIHIAFEEAYPSHILRGTATSKIPPIKLFGRIYKASESAFSAGAMRMRADLADLFIEKGEEMGVNFLDKEQAKPIGELVNSMTGRGNLGVFETSGRAMNILFFSARFLKSNIDILTAPIKYGAMKAKQAQGHKYNAGEVFARRTAALNTVKLISAIAAVLTIADTLQPGSVNWDSRSSDFGKIKIGNTRFDVTGGLGSLVILASRLAPTKHNGKWSQYTINSKGKTTNLRSEGFGRNALDVLTDWGTGKASPGAGVVLSMIKGENFDYSPVTYQSLLEQAAAPITLTSISKMKDEDAATIIIGSLAEVLGIGTSTY